MVSTAGRGLQVCCVNKSKIKADLERSVQGNIYAAYKFLIEIHWTKESVEKSGVFLCIYQTNFCRNWHLLSGLDFHEAIINSTIVVNVKNYRSL